ncbi:MAG: PEP-CTERM sorting domain-containing protein [Aquabacterium sp.]
MTFECKRLAVVLALAAAGAAHADTLVVKPGGATYQGQVTFAFDADARAMLDVSHMSVASYGTVNLVKQIDTDGYYTQLSVSTPMQSLTLDTDSLEILGVGGKGGVTITAPVFKSISSGGSLTITDIATDLSTKTVHATLIGGNGVGTISNFALWDFAAQSGPTVYTGNQMVNDITGLTLTAGGLAKISQSLGLLDLGQVSLNAIGDFGALHVVTNFTQICDPSPTSPGAGCGGPTPSVPEPASPVLMALGLGLLGMAMSPRRRRA